LTAPHPGVRLVKSLFATKSAAFTRGHHWSPIRLLYFECHYIEIKSGKTMSVVGVDPNVLEIDGKRLIVDSTREIASLLQ
jgi:hypothetical protein